jgi:glucose-6-phosphate isomerase
VVPHVNATGPAGLSVQVIDEQLGSDVDQMAGSLAGEQVASKLAAQDPTLWGEDAEAESSIRLSWTTLPESSRPLLATVTALRDALRAEGVTRVVLAGMGGSSLAPEVICATAGVALVVLDTTDAGQVREALEGDLTSTVLVVSSKSGSTLETDSHRRIFEQAFTRAGINAASRIVVVTDPGSPLHKSAEQAGYRAVITADPHVGGRYSALTAFGLVPSGLAGASIETLLDDAAAVAPSLATDSPDNPALRLGAALAGAHARGAEKVVLADTGSGITGFGDWAEQLIAESTGKNGTGLLPVVVEGPSAPGFADADDDATTVALGPPEPPGKLSVQGTLGAQFLLWETAVAVAGRLLGINPFDQPDVEAAKQAARDLLGGPGSGAERGGDGDKPLLVDGPVEVYGSGDWLTADGDLPDVAAAIRALVRAVPAHGYLAVQAYLDREADASAAVLRAELARRTTLQTTFGWGPRFLHSTGQYHKGGHQNGGFLQITGAVDDDLPIPGRDYGLATLQRAQALGDGAVLAGHDRPVLRLHLTDRAAGLAHVARAIEEVTS